MTQHLASRLLLCLIFLVSVNIQSQISFDAKVSKKRLGLNERLRVDFVMNENGDDFKINTKAFI